jgi:hypothetical protein
MTQHEAEYNGERAVTRIHVDFNDMVLLDFALGARSRCSECHGWIIPLIEGDLCD